jgi:hypothetical protein
MLATRSVSYPPAVEFDFLGWHAAASRLDDRPCVVVTDSSDVYYLTPDEARALAADLIRAADTAGTAL